MLKSSTSFMVGASSNISFLNCVTEAMELATNSNNFSSSATKIPIGSTWSPEDMLFPASEETVAPLDEQSLASSTVDLFALPSPTESDTLVRLYFSAVGLMIPCIQESPFLETYRQVRKMGARSARRSWLGLYNMILAMAANITTPTSPTEERARDSELYFNRALEFAKPLVLGYITFETVQLLLLMASYLQGTSRAAQTWTFHGVAVKGAYQLGLHSPAASRMLPLIDREIRNRTWCWCIMNDRILSATLGRPCLIPQSHVRVGELEGFQIANSVPRCDLSSIAFFDASTSLSYIMGGIVDQLYDQNLGFGTQSSIDDTLCRTFKLRLNLAQWQVSLPPDLQIIKSTDPAQFFSPRLENTRFRVLLSLRYLSTQILVLRPILQRFLDIPMVQAAGELRLSPLRDYGFSALRDLVSTCIDIFFISNNILAGSNRNLNLGAWWFSGYYTFNASLAILGVLLVEKTNLFPEIFLSLSVAEMRASLSNALDILRGLDNGNTMISKCQSTLKRLLHDYDKLDNS
ncbi:fungal-specific transcription factor domain-containing protein [Aspergillus cavernicola]|uniref:Fungal-specific transcription factor domain-containing protein n=1 Tax=Aspergillus cavernicola TaxID=176166 RepID=A0ABR4HXH3_9EURO